MTTKQQHTPGPWNVEQDEGTGQFVVVYQARDICRIHAQPGEGSIIGEKNALLIAAAPDLLEALRYASELIETARQYFPKSIKHSDTFQLNNVCATVSKAIAKAEGRGE